MTPDRSAETAPTAGSSADFRRFWLARGVSVLGSAVTTAVLPILVYQQTGSALSTAALGVVAVAPYLMFGLLAGALADRWDRRRLMVAADLGNAVLLATIPLAAAAGALTLPQIYVVAFASASLFVWFDAANFGAIAALVGRGGLVEANSRIWATTTTLEMAGPALGGALAATLGPAAAISADAASYLASALLLLRIGTSLGGGSDPGRAPALVAEVREGLAYLWRQPLIRTLTLLGFGNGLTAGGVMALLVVFAVRGLGMADDDGRIGLLMSAGAAGGLLASLLLPRLVTRLGAARLSLYGLTASPVLLMAVAAAPSFATALVLYVAWHTVYELVVINGITLRQRLIPDALQSRVNAAARMIAGGGLPLGAAFGGLVAEVVPIRTAYAALGAFVAASAIFGWFSPLHRSDPAAGA